MTAAASALTLGSLSARLAARERLPIKKGMLLSMLPKELSIADRFRLAKEAGFAEMECRTTRSPEEVQEVQAAARASGVRVHSVMHTDHWRYPLSSASASDVEQSVDCMEVSLRNARDWGADTVLLVPAVVNEETSYEQAWERSQRHIRKMLPLAKEMGVVIAVENVWNKFLLSPIEFARYVDEFQSPWLRAYFDVGNVVLFGYPQQWIRTLGERIVKVHLKDFRFQRDPDTGQRVAEFVPLREGDIQWPVVYDALAAIGYQGAATVELPGGDRAYIEEVSRRVDLILAGE